MATATSPPDLLTPPASSAVPSHHPSPLPQPRKHPLKPGGPKESELIRYLDGAINGIQKRVDNRVTNRKDMSNVNEDDGYGAFSQVAKALDEVVDVVWVSGSPNLQIPYLLNIAVLTSEYLPLFPSSLPSTQATFRLLAKLDYAFASLLTGHDAASDETLPGFEGNRTVTTTDKVRLKGIVDRTRLTVVRVLGEESVVDDTENLGEPMDTDAGAGVASSSPGQQSFIKFEGFDDDDELDDEWEEQGIGSVYEQTIGALGDVLGGPPIGIITEDWDVSTNEQSRRDAALMEPMDNIDYQ